MEDSYFIKLMAPGEAGEWLILCPDGDPHDSSMDAGNATPFDHFKDAYENARLYVGLIYQLKQGELVRTERQIPRRFQYQYPDPG